MAKINYIIGPLRGRALVWAWAYSPRTPLNTLPFEVFLKCSDRLDLAGFALDQLFTLLQGSHSVVEYASSGRSRQSQDGTEFCYRQLFTRGLSGQLSDGLRFGTE